MGRPKKDETRACAKQRIGEALWKLLEEHEIRDITVGMIVAEAQCNRGTFYYHYRDLEELMSSLFTAEFLEASLFTRCLFRMGTDDEYNIFDDLDPVLIQHLALAIDRAGFSVAYGKVRDAALELWAYLLNPDKSEVSPEAEAFIDYYVGGVLCMLAVKPSAIANTKAFGGSEAPAASLIEFSRKNYRFMLNEICAAEGVSPEVVLKRLEGIDETLKKHRTQQA